MRTSLALCLVFLACAEEPAVSPRSASTGVAVPGLLAVDWKDGTTKAEFDAVEGSFGIDVELNSVASAEAALTLAKGVDVTESLLARLRAHPLVEAAEPVFEYSATFAPDDPDFRYQWHMEQVGARAAWEWSTGDDVVVAVIDTGVARLSDLAETRFVAGYDFVSDDEDPEDDHGHGSHVAGTIAQTTHNHAGVAGLAHRAAIMPLKVLSASGSGTTVDIADAIRWAVDHGAKVLNLSLGGGGYSEVLADAVRDARDRGAVVVCAAGNGFGPPVNFPAAYDGAFAVSAVRFDRTLAPYSSYGKEVDLAAPGGDTSVDQNGDGKPDGVLQQVLGGEYALFQGTSMATPHVAAAAALVASAGVTRAEAIERILSETAQPIGDHDRFGAGLLDAAAAVRYVRLWGGLWRFALGLVVLLGAARLVRRRDRTVRPIGAAGITGLVLASAGALVLPLAGFGHPTPSALIATPLPEWGRMLGGVMSTSPIFVSALVPFFALGLSRVRILGGLAAGLCAGFAGYLAHAAFSGWVDVAWVPGRSLEVVWFVVNALLAAAFCAFCLRRPVSLGVRS